MPAEEIVRRAGVTRGALYHHFADKKDLFRVVHEQLEEELVARIAAAVAGLEDIIEVLERGLDAFLDACLDPVFSRISLAEAPSVLGWREWREIDARYGLGLMVALLTEGMRQGRLREQPVTPLGHILLSAMGEAGMLIADASDPRRARDEARGPLLALLEGLRAS